MPSSTTKMHVARREVPADVADTIRKALEHARVAGVLASYDRACFYDVERREVIVMISPDNMHPADRGNFGIERDVLDLLLSRALATHRITSVPPAPATERS